MPLGGGGMNMLFCHQCMIARIAAGAFHGAMWQMHKCAFCHQCMSAREFANSKLVKRALARDQLTFAESKMSLSKRFACD